MTHSAWIITIAAAAFAPIAARGADYHVAPPPLGDDSNPGTLAEPFATISKVEFAVAPGDTVHLHAGVYRESVLFRTSGTPASRITYQPYDDGSGADEVTISGFDLITPGTNGFGNWELHQGSIYKIQLPAGYALALGSSGLLLDGAAQKIARWPNVPAPFDFDWENMASPEGASVDEGSGGPQPGYSGTFHTATFTDNELPFAVPDELVGACVNLSPSTGVHPATGIVTGSGSQSVTFRYLKEFAQSITAADPYFVWNTLAALDEEGEYFFDQDAEVLYYWAPGGGSPAGREVEIRWREYAFDLNWTSYIDIAGLEFVGAGVVCPPSSSEITMDRLVLRQCGSGLNILRAGRGSIWLLGSDYSVTNCTIESSYGGGVRTGATDVEISNNVIRDCMLYSIGTWESSNNNVHHNTCFENAGENITMFSPGSQFNYNHCYHGGRWLSDSTSMNSHYDGDLLGMEVAYNWVHSNVARWNPGLGWGGGRGIRMDTSPSNVFIHHNLIWNISAPGFSMVLWSLDSNQVNHENSMLRAYNNTIDGQISMPGSGSIGGHDIRNNICTELREFSAELDPLVVTHNSFTIGKFAGDWPGVGNQVSADLSVSATTGNFELHASSDALDAGEHIPGITDGFKGSAPDVGALERDPAGGNPHWSAGAQLRPEDSAGLQFRALVKPAGSRFVVVSGMPVGRVPGRAFKLRLGGATVLDDHRLVYSTQTHRGEAYFEIADPGLSGSQAVEFALDGGSYQPAGSSVELSSKSLEIDSFTPVTTGAAGGTTHPVAGQGFSPSWMLPVAMLRTQGEDLRVTPVPVSFDSLSQIVAGRMNADCSDLRVRHWESNRELQHWIESGQNSATTFLWIKYAAGESPLTERFSHLDESVYYLTFGDPTLLSTSDPAVLLDSYPELTSPELQVWAAANSLVSTLADGDPVASWPNAGAGTALSHTNPSVQPQFVLDQIIGLPAVRFDGNSDFLQINGFSGSIANGYTVFSVLETDPANDSQGRLLSIGNGPVEVSHVRGGTSAGWRVRADRRPYSGGLTAIGTGRRFVGGSGYLTADLAELLVFSELLSESTGVGMDRVERYLRRKYGLGSTPYGAADSAGMVPPTRFFLDGQTLASVTIQSDSQATFIAPPLAGLDPAASLPVAVTLSATKGPENVTASEALLYFEPAYDAWSLGLPPGLRGELDDADTDLLTNLVEFGTGSDALSSEGAWHQGAQSPGVGSLRFLRNKAATDVLLSIGYSTDLVSWSSLPLDHPRISIVDPDPNGDGSAVLYEITALDPADPRAFYRLEAVRILP